MTKHAMPAQWRLRRHAIGKKGALDVELLEETEASIVNKKQPEVQSGMYSPTSVFQVPELLPEMKPILLPGAWVVVGKRGKPVVNTKMYEPPVVAKKKRIRTSKAEAILDSIWALEEAPSSSKCLQDLRDITSRLDKAASRGQTAKYWARYRQAHKLKVHARDVLLASAMFAEGDDQAIPFEPEELKQRDNKKNSAREKNRRRARDAKAEQAFWPAELDEPVYSTAVIEVLPTVMPTVAVREPKSKPMLPAGWWSVVGKYGKTVKYERPSRRRPRSRKSKAILDSIWALEEAPSSSKCLQDLRDITSRLDKAASRGQTAKYWARQRQAHKLKVHARDALLASAMFAEGDEDQEDAVCVLPLKKRDNKKNGARDKARRRARQAKDELRCGGGAEEDGSWELPSPVEAARMQKPKRSSPKRSSPKRTSPASSFVVVDCSFPPTLRKEHGKSPPMEHGNGKAEKRQKVKTGCTPF